MLRIFALTLLLAGCGGVAFDTRVAEQQATRLAMIQSVDIGLTTEPQFTTRWGDPLQKVRDGARVEYVYRSRTGDHSRYVIVTFEYGVAIAVRSNDTVGCRASFAPRVPGFAGDTPDIVKPVGWCANPNDAYDPQGAWNRLTQQEGNVGQPRPNVGSDVYGAGKYK